MKVPRPRDEAQRLEILRQYEVLDTPAEQAFDDLTLLAAHICQVPISLVTFVDENRQWFKSRRGIDTLETSREIAFCAHAILSATEVMEVQDARSDPRFQDNPSVTGAPHICFYAGAPLVGRDGQAVGTICVVDRVPRHLTTEQLTALQAISRRVVAQLELRSQNRRVANEAVERQNIVTRLNQQYDQLAINREEAGRSLLSAEKSRRALLSVLEDEKRAGQELRESEERFRQLIENSTDVIVVIDAAGVIGFQSPSMQRTLGYPAEAMAGRCVFDIIHPEDRARVGQSIKNVLGQPEVPKMVEYRIRHHEGRWLIFQSIGKSMIEPSGQVKIVVNSRDVTESRLLEEKFLRAQRMEAIGTLASGVAHDLNNILTPMLMVAGLLKETLMDPHDRDMLTMVERSAQRGATIISQLLAFSRGVEGSRATVQPQQLLREIANLIQETFPRDIELNQDVPGDLWSVVVDSTQLHQVLLNLCVNARDAMPDGGQLTLAARNVHLSEQEVQAHPGATPGRHVLITVTDTGQGIPPVIIDRIFDPFFTTKQIGKGTGLGLSTVIGILKSHHGFVNVYSEPGNGTVFRVYLPAVEVMAPAEPVAEAAPRLVGNGELILLVDDEPHILGALKELLDKHQYRVLSAANGEEAIRVFIEHGESIQLVVTDVMMPVMGGLALINTLRVLKPGIKVIATTGLEQKEKTGEFAALGVTVILAKPFSPAVLLQALDQTLKKKT